MAVRSVAAPHLLSGNELIDFLKLERVCNRAKWMVVSYLV